MRVIITNAVGPHTLGPADLPVDEARRLVHEGYAIVPDPKAKAKNIDEILADVGEDPAKAAEALAAELAATRPRTTLVDALTAIAGTNTDQEV